jgi:hypothetical protein
VPAVVTDALAAKRADPQVRVPWSGFDLINAFNAWKRSEAAGRVFAVAPDGTATQQVTGLAWRHEVAAQVFEEAAVDLGRALAAYAAAKAGGRKGRIGFPRRKKKDRWHVSLTIEAPDLHPQTCHPHRPEGDHGGWVGLDRGLVAFAVAATADGVEVGRFQAPRPLVRRLGRRRRRCRALSRTQQHAQVPDRQAGGRVSNASGGEGAGRRRGDGATGPGEGGTDAPAVAGAEDTRAGWRRTTSTRSFDAR